MHKVQPLNPLIYECAWFAVKNFTCIGLPDSHALTAQKLVEMLTAARRLRGWSQETWAVAAKVSPSCIQHLEHSRSTPTLITLLRLAKALEMDLPDLLREAQKTAEPKKPNPRR